MDGRRQPPGGGRVLVLVAKEPRPGRAKTRLAAGVGAERAARLADAFIRDTLAVCRSVAGAETWISTAAESSRAYFERLAPEARLLVQPEGDLGVRLRAAFDAAFAAGAERVVAIGCDTPQLPRVRLDAAFAALAPGRAVVGPARDGGYYLIGLAQPAPELFEGVAWSTGAVLAETERRAARLGLAWTRLPEAFDVDAAADLERLRAILAADRALCPATRALLEA